MKVNFKKPAIAENSIGKKTNTKTKKLHYMKFGNVYQKVKMYL